MFVCFRCFCSYTASRPKTLPLPLHLFQHRCAQRLASGPHHSGSGQQSITFTNNSGSAVDIRFEPNPVYSNVIVFNDIVGLSSNHTNTQTPQVANGSVNYHVVVGATRYGPYAIQVGSGPLYIQLSYDSAIGKIVSTPDSPAIPAGGTVEMVSADLTYNVSWSSGDPFTPALTSVGVGVSNNAPHQENASQGDYTYQLTPSGNMQYGNGGGKVIVKGS